MASMYAQILKEKKPLNKYRCDKCGTSLRFVNKKWWCNRCMKAVKINSGKRLS